MSGFKLLAIRPLKGCDTRWIKTLREGEVYQFYADYIFEKKDPNDVHSEVIAIRPPSNTVTDLFKVKDINVNISAVVGENGSGKSTLVELLFMTCYMVAVQEKILKRQKKHSDLDLLIEELNKSIHEKKSEIDSLHDDQGNVRKEHYPTNQYTGFEQVVRILDFRRQRLVDDVHQFEQQVAFYEGLNEEILAFSKGLKVEIFYELDDSKFRLKVTNSTSYKRNVTITKIESPKTDLRKEVDEKYSTRLDLNSSFFYSLVLNYSIYSLNTEELGDWISELFHKNDGYQTPIVLNPMRVKGVIDINNENYLVRSRLLSVILMPVGEGQVSNPRNLVGDKIASHIKLARNDSKLRSTAAINTDLWERIEQKFFSDAAPERKPTDWDDDAKRYIFNKLENISENYPSYYRFSGSEGLILLEFDNYLDAIEGDDSHITFKFFQAINFLKYDYARAYFEASNWTDLDDLSDKISVHDLDLMLLVPPAFLDVDIRFVHGPNGGEESDLSTLSSGERQKVYSISSLIYHLNYLDSVKPEDPVLRYKYRYINLIFDEVELYYHPEFQRGFVTDLLHAISSSNLNYIKDINCLLITHSPFILSDLPCNNILRLKKGVAISNKENTFGANIHDLLANDFFMSNGFMGEFAKSQIEGVISFLRCHILLEELKELEASGISEETKERKEEILDEFGRVLPSRHFEKNLDSAGVEVILQDCMFKTPDEYRKLLFLIGEPVLREKLLGWMKGISPLNEKEEVEELQRRAEKLGYTLKENE